MSKFTNLAAGALGGFVAGRQAKERKKRDDTWDKFMQRQLDKDVPVEERSFKEVVKVPVEKPVPTNNTVEVFRDPMAGAQIEEKRLDEAPAAGYANGGMIMPVQSDRFGWQKTNFKKR